MSTPEGAAPARPVRVFISYAWEDQTYREAVKSLAARLRKDGVEARLDAWDRGALSIPEFMNHEIRNADKVLVLCSPAYQEKVHEMEDDDRVTGVGWEAMLVNSAIWNSKRRRNQVEVVLFRGTWSESAPDFLQALPYIDLSRTEEFEANYLELLRRLTGHVEMAPPLGQVPGDLRPPSAVPLKGPPSRTAPVPPVASRRVASSISPEGLEKAVIRKAETEFQAAFEKILKSPIPQAVLSKRETNRAQDYRPFAVFDWSMNIQIEGSLLPLLATRIQIESDLRRSHRLQYSPERVEALKEQMNALAVEELVHIIRAAFEDALGNVENYYGSVPSYKKRELEEHREQRLNERPEGLFKKISLMVDEASAQLVLDLSQEG